MATVPATPAKVNKAFYAFLDDTHGILTKVHGTMYFMSDSGAITEIEPAHCAGVGHMTVDTCGK